MLNKFLITAAGVCFLLARKTRHLLDGGTSVVWVVYPDTREVNVIRATSDEWLGVDDIIEDSALLPGFSAPVRAFFSARR